MPKSEQKSEIKPDLKKQIEPTALPMTFEKKVNEALMSVWWTSMMLKKSSARFFQSYPVSDAQFNVLVLLKYSKEALTQNDLSKKLLVDKSNTTGLIDRMEKSGFIKRESVSEDRRSYHIKLTKKGDDLMSKLDKEYEARVRQIMSALSEKEHDDLIRLMKKLRTGIVDSEPVSE